jgi:hypothetical protein
LFLLLDATVAQGSRLQVAQLLGERHAVTPSASSFVVSKNFLIASSSDDAILRLVGAAIDRLGAAFRQRSVSDAATFATIQTARM